jgi:hypothetical protein
MNGQCQEGIILFGPKKLPFIENLLSKADSNGRRDSREARKRTQSMIDPIHLIAWQIPATVIVVFVKASSRMSRTIM